MHYFIDGYNVLFRLVKSGDHLAEKRQQIIRDINLKAKATGIDVTLVFDSQYHPSESTHTHYNQVEIHFTDTGETADNFILKELKRKADPRHETVVTSDNKLAWYARRRGAKTETVEEFVEWLNRRYKNKMRQGRAEKKSKVIEETQQRLRAKAQESLPEDPVARSTAEECFEYYLKEFEQEYQELVKNEPVKAVKEKKGKPLKEKIPKTKRSTDEKSDMERWLRLFTQKG